jgi:hypothetical protein
VFIATKETEPNRSDTVATSRGVTGRPVHGLRVERSVLVVLDRPRALGDERFGRAI